MSQPPPYSPVTSFITYQAQQAWFPGQQLDVEFNDIETSIAAIRTNLAVIQNDDTTLGNGTVGFAQLSTALATALTAIGVAVPISTVLTQPNTWTAAQTFTPPSPTWGTNYGLYQGLSVNVNGVPLNAILGGASGASPAAISSAINIPSNDVGSFVSTAGAFTTLTAAALGGVGLFAAVIQSGNSGQTWAFNTVASNTPITVPTTDNIGFDGSPTAAEFDVGVFHKAGGVTPIGTARGVLIAGGAKVVPTGGAFALEISQFGNGGANLAWTNCIQIDGQPSQNAILIGSQSLTNAATTYSQNLSFGSVNSSAVVLNSQIYADPNGTLTLNPASVASGGLGSVNILNGASGTIATFAPAKVTMAQPLVMSSKVVFGDTTAGGLLVLTSTSNVAPSFDAIYNRASIYFWQDTAGVTTHLDFGSTASNTFTYQSKIVTAASATTAAGINLPSGTAPTSPVAGDMWNDGTNLKFRFGSTDTLAALAAAQTLTNKTIAFSSNTLTGVAPLASPTFTGTVTVPAVTVGVNQVVGARATGWTVATGTPQRSTFTTGGVTLAQLAGVVMALEQDLIAHGLIGT